MDEPSQEQVYLSRLKNKDGVLVNDFTSFAECSCGLPLPEPSSTSMTDVHTCACGEVYLVGDGAYFHFDEVFTAVTMELQS